MDPLKLLRRVSIFDELADEDLAQIAPIARRVNIPARTPICHQNRPGDALYIVANGTLESWHTDQNGRRHSMGTLQVNDCLGGDTFLTGAPLPISVQAISDSELLKIPRSDWDALLKREPGFEARWSTVRARMRQPETQATGNAPELFRQAGRGEFTDYMPGERKVISARKHWWALVLESLKSVGLLVAVILIAVIITMLASNTPEIIIATWFVAFLFASVGLALFVLDWRNDLYLVTNRRILHIERVLLTRIERREVPLDKIQNVQQRQPTLFHQVIGVSDIVINTAADYGTITFANVNQGDMIRNHIFAQINQFKIESVSAPISMYKEEAQTRIDNSPKPKVGFKPKFSPRLHWRDRFRNQFRLRVQDGNTITWRKHFFALIRQAWVQSLGILVLLPLTSLSIFGILPGREIVAPVLFSLIAVCALAFFVQLLDWSNDIYMLTEDRVVDIERNAIGVLVKPSVEAPFSAVQNVSFTQPNPLYLFLNMGHVIIQTAGATGQMVFYWISNPSQVSNEILTRVDESRRAARQAELEQLRTDVRNYVDSYNRYLKDEDRLRGAAPRPADSPPIPGSDDPPPAQ